MAVTQSLAGDGKQRFTWETRTRRLVEEAIRTSFPRLSDIRWTADCKGEVHLDRAHGIDVIGEYTSGQPLTFQAKVLATDYTTLTVESYNHITDKLGDWCECISDYILWIYAPNGEEPTRWALVSRPLLTIATAEGRICWRTRNPIGNAGSCFKFVEFADVLERAPEVVRKFEGDWITSNQQ